MMAIVYSRFVDLILENCLRIVNEGGTIWQWHGQDDSHSGIVKDFFILKECRNQQHAYMPWRDAEVCRRVVYANGLTDGLDWGSFNCPFEG